MALRKVAVSELKPGMYVAELDRPWTETPFLFQGFTIESEDDIRQLREHCQHVFVDRERSSEFHEDEDKTIQLSVRNKLDEDRAERDSSITIPQARQRELRERLAAGAKARGAAKRFIVNALRDARMGQSLRTEKAKEVVEELVERIYEDADALLWLTNLKKEHEYTANHCVNVCILTLAFGAHLGYPKEFLRTIGLGALLHDVGKMKTPQSILNKPGRLTPEEFEIMKRHPLDGYELVKSSGHDLPRETLDIIRSHHERLSGRGYPDGLKGDEISTSVLMVAICDVYDAITSDRVYHHGIPAHEGLSAMYQLAPNDFGRELMQEFIKCVGIYPVGSLVELESGALGIVVSNDPKNRLRPVVMLIRDPGGDFYSPRRYVSLAALSQKGTDAWKWVVKRVADPKGFGIDMQSILAAEITEGGTATYHI